MGDFLGPLNQIFSGVMGYFLGSLNQIFSRVMGYFFGPLGQFFQESWAIFWDPASKKSTRRPGGGRTHGKQTWEVDAGRFKSCDQRFKSSSRPRK